MTYRYKPEILTLLATHGVIPKPTTPPTTARSVVNDIYRYELRLLRDRYLVGSSVRRLTTTKLWKLETDTL